MTRSTVLPSESYSPPCFFININFVRMGNVQLIKQLRESGLQHPRIKKLKAEVIFSTLIARHMALSKKWAVSGRMTWVVLFL